MDIEAEFRKQRYQIDQLQRRVQQLETTRNFVAQDGSFTVFDDTGAVVARLGKQDDGSYDVAVFNASGEDVRLSTLSFDQQFGFVATSESTTSTSATNLSTVGPSVTVDVGATGKVLVMFSAITTVSASGASSLFGVSVDGGAVAAASGFSHNFGGGSGGSGAASVRAITGLTAGSHTFTLKYWSSNGTSVSFQNRSLLVLPY